MLRQCGEYGLPEPAFIDPDGDFRVKMYRQPPQKDSSHANDTENDTKVLNPLRENPAVTQTELKEKLRVSTATMKRLMPDLQKRGVIERQGSDRKGKRIIIGQEKQ